MSRRARPSGLVREDGSAITRRDVARARAGAFTAAGFDRSNTGAGRAGFFLNDWRVGLRSADADWLRDRDQATARARDVTRNHPIGASGLARRVNSAVGFRWRLSARPDPRLLGIDPKAAQELGRQIESRFEGYAYGSAFQADAERQLTFGQLLRCGAAHIHQDGEALGLVEFAGDEGTEFGTRMRMVDPDRVSNPNGVADGGRLANGNTVTGGVERNQYGVRIAYHIREAHPHDVASYDGKAFRWRRFEVHSTPLGRPQVLHAFDKLRAGQTRGVSRLVALLKTFKGFSTFTDATIEVATLNALFLGFIKSNSGLNAISDSFEPEDMKSFIASRDEFYDDDPISVGGVQIPVLGYDDEFQMATTARDTTGFDAFTRSILRLIAAALGLSYEELSMDFSQTNYSSARAAMLVAWNETLALRGLIEAQIAVPFYVAWLEELFDLGLVELPAGAPDFYDAIDAYARCRWIGPGRGYVDPTKEIDAAAARIEAGISTLEDECADQGKDWEDVQDQALFEQLREQQRREALGLPPKSQGQALYAAGQDARDPLRNKELEQQPAPEGKQGSALARVRAVARSPEHEAALEARVSAPTA